MGLHISLSRVAPGQRYGDEVRWFDATRFTGDREFDSYCLGVHGQPDTQNIVCRDDPEYRGWGDVPVIYWRPADLQAAERWVRAHIVEENQPRLLAAIEAMRGDPLLYFHSAW